MATFEERRNFIKNFLFCGCMITIGLFLEEKILNKDINFINQNFTAMNTNGKIHVFSEKKYNVDALVKDAIRRIKEIEKLVNQIDPLSEINKFNSIEPKYHALSRDDLFLIETSVKLKNKSSKNFDFKNISINYAINEAFKILINNNIKHAAIEFGNLIKVYEGLPWKDKWKIKFNDSNKKFLNIKTGFISTINNTNIIILGKNSLTK